MRKLLIALAFAGLVSQTDAGEQDDAIPPGWSLSPEYQQHQKQERQKQQNKQQQTTGTSHGSSASINNERNVLRHGAVVPICRGACLSAEQIAILNDKLLEEMTFTGTCGPLPNTW